MATNVPELEQAITHMIRRGELSHTHVAPELGQGATRAAHDAYTLYGLVVLTSGRVASIENVRHTRKGKRAP